ncbi:chlororespiratory reduction protein 7 [Candidatus Synechococcus calcipolaris]|nr:chlororespiratory reduction protein 7 [Candidatus Synechococcus calcipolaris]
MYSQEMYVVLEPDQGEVLLTPSELLAKLEACLGQQQDDLPYDLRSIVEIPAQAAHLMETGCELDLGNGRFIHWYAVRLEK